MLTKYIDRSGSKKRTSYRAVTPEGLALKELRQAYGLSMRQLGERVGKSDSYISHLENGRLDFPRDSALDNLLAVFDGMKPKSFFERARKCRTQAYQEEFIVKWVRQASKENIEAVYGLLTQ